MHTALLVSGFFATTLDCRMLLSYARPAVGLGRHAQLPPGNFPKPSQAKCHFTADGAGAFKKSGTVPTTKEEERHVMDNSETRRDLHRPRDQRVPAG
jgi:hypothetical protein